MYPVLRKSKARDGRRDGRGAMLDASDRDGHIMITC